MIIKIITPGKILMKILPESKNINALKLKIHKKPKRK